MGAPLAPLEFWFEGGLRQVAPFLFLFLGLNVNNLVLFSFHVALVLRVRRGCFGVRHLRLADRVPIARVSWGFPEGATRLAARPWGGARAHEVTFATTSTT